MPKVKKIIPRYNVTFRKYFETIDVLFNSFEDVVYEGPYVSTGELEFFIANSTFENTLSGYHEFVKREEIDTYRLYGDIFFSKFKALVGPGVTISIKKKYDERTQYFLFSNTGNNSAVLVFDTIKQNERVNFEHTIEVDLSGDSKIVVDLNIESRIKQILVNGHDKARDHLHYRCTTDNPREMKLVAKSIYLIDESPNNTSLILENSIIRSLVKKYFLLNLINCEIEKINIDLLKIRDRAKISKLSWHNETALIDGLVYSVPGDIFIGPESQISSLKMVNCHVSDCDITIHPKSLDIGIDIQNIQCKNLKINSEAYDKSIRFLSIRNSKILKNLDLSGAPKIKNSVSLKKTYIKYPPNLSSIDIGLSLELIELTVDTKELDAKYKVLALQRKAIELHCYEDAKRMFNLERSIRLKQKDMECVERLCDYIYYAHSKRGEWLGIQLLWICSLSVAFSFVYYSQGLAINCCSVGDSIIYSLSNGLTLETWYDSLRYSVINSFGPVSLLGTKYLSMYQPSHWFLVAKMIQGILCSILWFLFILGIRNRFKLI